MNEWLTEIANDVLADARVACCAMRYFRPPQIDDPKFDFAVDAVTLSICRTLESAIAVFDLGDHNSAAALARKALEYDYVLVLLRRKGAKAIELVETWCRRSIGSDMRKLLKDQGGDFSNIDKPSFVEAIKEYERSVPNGELTRVPETMLASWAGLSDMHVGFYSQLNAHAHFDYLQAAALQQQVRIPNDPVVVSNLLLDRAEIAIQIQEVVLLAIHALREMGASKMSGVLANQQRKFDRLNAEMIEFVSERGQRNAELSGWREPSAQ